MISCGSMKSRFLSSRLSCSFNGGMNTRSWLATATIRQMASGSVEVVGNQ